MKPPGYIGPEEYLDSPRTYGQHAPFWNSLSFLEKVDTILHVGFFSFLREVLGFADAERIHQRLELKHNTLCSDYEKMQERLAALEQENQELQQQLEKSEQFSRGKSHRLLTLPSAQDIMDAFNRNSVGDGVEGWFFNPYEDPDTGVVTLDHNFIFYPFPSIKVPRGKLRLYDQYGTVANLAQCVDYRALPARYAQHLVPDGFQAYRMRVLFVTEKRDYWLADPLSAQDVVLEIWARCTEGRSPNLYDLRNWKERYSKNNAMVGGHHGKQLFILIVPIEGLLGRGENNFSEKQINRIRYKCYAEYLDIYFHDQYDDEIS